VSDNWLQFVPIDPNWQPTLEAADRAVALLTTMADDPDAVEASFKDSVEFVYAWSNWSGVKCPSCGTDLEEWWWEALGKAHEDSGFNDLNVVAPCCGAPTSLNDLDFEWPVGFGRFVLEAMNPGFIPSEEQERELAECLGVKLRVVWRRL
jgi:hypothetical protein